MDVVNNLAEKLVGVLNSNPKSGSAYVLVSAAYIFYKLFV